MIYFIQKKHDKKSPIKIGFSKNPKKRLKEIQTGSSDIYEILNIKEGDYPEETKIHKKFTGSRIKGEWFVITKALIFFIFGYIPIDFREVELLDINKNYYVSFDGISIKQIKIVEFVDKNYSKVKVIKSYTNDSNGIHILHNTEIRSNPKDAAMYQIIK